MIPRAGGFDRLVGQPRRCPALLYLGGYTGFECSIGLTVPKVAHRAGAGSGLGLLAVLDLAGARALRPRLPRVGPRRVGR